MLAFRALTVSCCFVTLTSTAGYVGRDDLTAAKFIPNPFWEDVKPNLPENLWEHYRLVYRTGDLVAWKQDGRRGYQVGWGLGSLVRVGVWCSWHHGEATSSGSAAVSVKGCSCAPVLTLDLCGRERQSLKGWCPSFQTLQACLCTSASIYTRKLQLLLKLGVLVWEER